MSTLMTLKDVSVVRRRMDTLIHALTDISLDIEQGEWLGIIGRNGSGKSTLARVLAGLSRVSGGEVQRDGIRGSAPHSNMLLHNAGASAHPAAAAKAPVIRIVLQNPDAQIVGQTIYEDLCFGMENTCVPPDEMSGRALDALKQVGLELPFDTPIEHLSGGQKQLLCVAGALVTNPDCVIFDEPTAMLDPLSRHRLLTTVAGLHRGGLTVIWITQWTEELTFADRVLGLTEGRMTFHGTPRSFFYEACAELGYPQPYAVQVAMALAAREVKLADRPMTADELAQALEGATTRGGTNEAQRFSIGSPADGTGRDPAAAAPAGTNVEPRVSPGGTADGTIREPEAATLRGTNEEPRVSTGSTPDGTVGKPEAALKGVDGQ